MKFGDYLRAIRLERGMTLDDMAVLLGTSKQVLSKYENHQRTPKVTVANGYAEKLGVSLGSLIGSEPKKSPAEAEEEKPDWFIAYESLSPEYKLLVQERIRAFSDIDKK